MIDKIVDTDVLVIGGGVAGLYAALETTRQNSKVLLVTKGLLGKSCCSVEAQMFLSPHQYSPSDTLEKHLRHRVSSYGGYVIDQEIQKATLVSAPRFIKELEELGLYWRRYPDGEIAVQGEGSAYRNLIAFKHGDTGKNITWTLTQEFRRHRIPYLEDTVVTRLLTNNGTVVGAIAISYRTGEIIALRAKAVVMAAGPGGWLWTYSTMPATITGDGLVMAYRAGAELTGIEFNQWHFSDHVRVPGTGSSRACFRQNLGPSTTPEDDKSMWSPIWVNSKGERFMEQWEKSLGLLKHEQAMAVIDQVKKGNATFTSGIYGSLKHVPPEQLKSYLHLWRWLEKIGIDTTKDLVEVGMCTHWMIGGIRVNPKFETNMPGLYAAGGVTFGATSLVECLYSGRTSAQQAANRAKSVEIPELNQSQIEGEAERIQRYMKTEPAAGFSPAQIKRRIREIMWEKMHYIKNEKNMREALELLRKVREDMVPKMRLESGSKRFNYAWVEALDVVNMLDLTELIINVSLMRKESRKQFQREDYPKTDDQNWLQNIVITCENGKMKTRMIPVELKYVRPD